MKTLKEFIQNLENIGNTSNDIPILESKSVLSKQMVTLKSNSISEIQNLILSYLETSLLMH